MRSMWMQMKNKKPEEKTIRKPEQKKIKAP
jgi:hypothetical protein